MKKVLSEIISDRIIVESCKNRVQDKDIMVRQLKKYKYYEIKVNSKNKTYPILA